MRIIDADGHVLLEPSVPTAANTSGRACALAAGFGFALVVATFYPGIMNVDASIQLKEARSGQYSDWHPPAMAAVWGVLDAIAPGPVGILILHNLLFWAGLGLTVYLAGFRPCLAVVMLLAVGLSPPVFSALGAIWKDVGMGAALLLAFALLWWSEVRSSRLAIGLAMPCLGYALAVRHNAAPAVLPLALWAPFLWMRSSPRVTATGRGRLIVTGLIVFVLLVAATAAFNRRLTAQRLYPLQQILLHDLLGISVRTGENRLPPSVTMENGPAGFDDVRCLYSPQSAVAPYSANFGACRVRIHKIVKPEPMADLEAAWERAVLRDPRAYLAHRWSAMVEQLGWQRPRVCYPLDVRSRELEYTFTRLQRPAERALAAFAYRTPMFRGWLYLALTAAVLLVAGRGPGRTPLLVVGASGLLYGLAYFVVSTACAFRMNWWFIVAALVSVIVALGCSGEERSG